MYQFLNNAYLCGTVVSEPEFSHETADCRYFKFNLSTLRKSGYTDTIIIMAEETQLQNLLPLKGKHLFVAGGIRTYNETDETGTHVRVFVKAYTIEESAEADFNRVELGGRLTRDPHKRTTPMGKVICDFILATPRNPHRNDYIPCIVWGRVADMIGSLNAKSEVSAKGRIQSRIYTKDEDGEMKEKIAYEVSINQLLN